MAIEVKSGSRKTRRRQTGKHGVRPDPVSRTRSLRSSSRHQGEPDTSAGSRSRAGRSGAGTPDMEDDRSWYHNPSGKTPFGLLDRQFRSQLGHLTHGISPISLAEAWHDWVLHLGISPGKLAELSKSAHEDMLRYTAFVAYCALVGRAPDHRCIEPLPQDRRFENAAWDAFPFNAISQAFLMTQKWWQEATTRVSGVNPAHERLVQFYSRQILDMMSPSNSIAFNPEVLERTMREAGANLVRGAGYWLDDLDRWIRQADPAGAENYVVGKNVATTKGSVVFRNDLMELIQYAPETATVYREPVLIVPAWIMKYYILDLSPENSLIHALVERGFTVFCISWKNPGPEDRDTAFDDYRVKGVMAALDVVEAITGSPKIHVTGYCLGGTLSAIAAADMARKKDHRLQSLTLLAAQLDFKDAGELTLFINESQVSMIEDMMWETGYLDQRQMAGAFQMLRSRDLIWSRMVRHYLLGDPSRMNDLMAWNADATRLPYRMHSEYLRRLFLNNELAEGRYRVDGHPLFLDDITQPAFVLATLTDHVSPWRSVFKLLRLMENDIRFVLTSGGHNAGIVSPPGKPRRSYRMLDRHGGVRRGNPDQWIKGVEPHEGSWWPVWWDWLAAHSTPGATPPPMGCAQKGYEVLEAAPGRYVFEP